MATLALIGSVALQEILCYWPLNALRLQKRALTLEFLHFVVALLVLQAQFLGFPYNFLGLRFFLETPLLEILPNRMLLSVMLALT
jgi:hypothetical protein